MPQARRATLADWLAWQETLHPSEIDLGLARVRQVARRLLKRTPGYPVITVAGTNGKGSVCAYLDAMLTAAGLHVGVYTSPHLVRYNERVLIGGQPVSDAQLVDAFARIDAARGDTSLTYFEFGTLAALLVFQQADLDCAVLEVGLGGRLDAVNLLDADVAVITNIGLDHQQWLGEQRSQIAREKAGIMRPGKPAVCGDRDPPQSLLERARRVGAPLSCLGRDFDWYQDSDSWRWVSEAATLTDLPLPALAGAMQLDNAALAIAALQAPGPNFSIAAEPVRQGLERARLRGRIECIGVAPQWVLDVAHNPDAAAALSAWLADHPVAGDCHLLFGMLRDKDVAGVARELAPHVNAWHLVSLAGERGLTGEALRERIADELNARDCSIYPDVMAAMDFLKSRTGLGDRIVVCGSFHTVGAALAHGL